MTVVRELITRLGFTVNQAEFAEAERAYEDLQKAMLADAKTAKAVQAAMSGMGGAGDDAAEGAKKAKKETGLLGEALGMFQRFNAQVGISNLLREYVGLASDANETTGAMKELFGEEGRTQVQEWSATMGAAMGRSQYDLQAYATRLGSVLGPVTASQEEAQAMAQSLSELAVDLGSFFNTSDQEAMMALRSGLTGEYESLKRFGVVINEATLAEVAHGKGIKKKVTQMTTAEKTALRYAAIIERTKAASGDAARTSEGFANASKALAAQLKDLGIGMAQTVIPQLQKLVRFARDTLTWFNKFQRGTSILEAAMYTLGAAAVVLGAEFYAAFIMPTLAIAAIMLLVDELITLFRGGKTVIGEFVNAMAGAGAAEDWVRNQIVGWQLIREAIAGAWATLQETWAAEGGWAGIMNTVQGFWEDFGVKIGDWMAKVIDMIMAPLRKVRSFLTDEVGFKAEAPELSYERRTTRGLTEGGGTQDFNAFHAQRHAERAAAGAAGPTGDLRGRLYATGRGLGAGTSTQAGIAAVSGTPTAATPPTAAAPGTVTAPAAAAGGAGGAPQAAPAPVIVPVATAAPTININGGDTSTVVAKVKRALAEDRKAQIAAVARKGGA